MRRLAAFSMLWLAALPAVVAAQQAPAAAEPAHAAPAGARPVFIDPPLRPDSPRDSMVFEDRRVIGQRPPGPPYKSAPAMVQVTLPGDPTGTSTGHEETFRYQLPTGYDGTGAPRPLVVAWHGYSMLPESVENMSTIDEECDARGWIYMAPTGLEQHIFGTPLAQENVAAAIAWMLDQFLVDADRIYMIGFSMGGGIVADFAARHRDPEGLMIAAVVTVSGTFDWTLTYNLGTDIKAVLQHPLNFGGPPSAAAFKYEQASALYAVPSTYPPAPGANDAMTSMGDNLHGTPLYMAWDIDDPLVENPGAMAAQLGTLLVSLGGTVQVAPTSHTIDPANGNHAPHSWAVLDEVEAFDFLADKVAVRMPAVVHAQLDQNAPVAWTQTTQKTSNAFTWLDGSAAGNTLVVVGVSNAGSVRVDLGEAGLGGVWPLHVVAGSADAIGFTLTLAGFDQPPSYALSSVTGALVPGMSSDPLIGTFSLHVPAQQTLDVNLHSVPWLAKLWTAPQPTSVGGSVVLRIDAPADNHPPLAFLVISLSELLTPIKNGGIITASLPGGVIIPLLLDANGDAIASGPIGNDPGLSGLHLPMQAIVVDGGGALDSISNLWALDIQ